MCLVCAEFNAGRLTSKEALRNLGEMVQDAASKGDEAKRAHYFSAVDKIMEKELGTVETDREMDKLWQKEMKKR